MGDDYRIRHIPTMAEVEAWLDGTERQSTPGWVGDAGERLVRTHARLFGCSVAEMESIAALLAFGFALGRDAERMGWDTAPRAR